MPGKSLSNSLCAEGRSVREDGVKLEMKRKDLLNTDFHSMSRLNYPISDSKAANILVNCYSMSHGIEHHLRTIK